MKELQKMLENINPGDTVYVGKAGFMGNGLMEVSSMLKQYADNGVRFVFEGEKNKNGDTLVIDANTKWETVSMTYSMGKRNTEAECMIPADCICEEGDLIWATLNDEDDPSEQDF